MGLKLIRGFSVLSSILFLYFAIKIFIVTIQLCYQHNQILYAHLTIFIAFNMFSSLVGRTTPLSTLIISSFIVLHTFATLIRTPNLSMYSS